MIDKVSESCEKHVAARNTVGPQEEKTHWRLRDTLTLFQTKKKKYVALELRFSRSFPRERRPVDVTYLLEDEKIVKEI